MTETSRARSGMPDPRSLQWKLPWLFGLTATLTVAAFGVFAYGAVRRVALESTSTRLESALSQVSSIIGLGVVGELAALRGVAHHPALVRALRSEGAAGDSAVAVLRQLRGLADSNVVVELFDQRGRVRHVIPPSAAVAGTQRTLTAPPYAAIGPIYERNGTLYFESTVAITDNGTALGHVRVTRRQGNAVNRRMVSRMVDQGVLLTGNVNGVLWSDAGPTTFEPAARGVAKRYLRDGERWLSVSRPIMDTPWVYAVEVPERVALAPAHALLTTFALSGVIIALVGAFVGLRVSRRITRPLADLTDATEAIARGDRDVALVATDRPDEIGRLARAFAAMATSVVGARDRLEAEVMERTGELSTASGQLRLLHEELREAEKFASLGRMSGSVGHELRNPLGVMSNVVFLLDTLPEASDTLKNYARLLREQIRVSDRIISDLLDRARSGVPVRTAVNISRVLDDIELRARIPATVRVDRQLPAAIPPLVLDRDHLTQILWNLVTNAVQAMKGDGTLTMRAAWVDGHLRIEVRDTGGGIADADLERIFGPMYTTKEQGIGLGLSISRAFARANGGDLVAIPGEGGACFVLDLPAAIAHGEGGDPPRETARDLNISPARTSASRVQRDSPTSEMKPV